MVTWLRAGAAINTAHANKIAETVFFMNLFSFPTGPLQTFPFPAQQRPDCLTINSDRFSEVLGSKQSD
jgi:hypothetical protein